MNGRGLFRILLAFGVALIALGNAQRNNAGFGVRINRGGLNFLKDLLLELVDETLTSQSIPNFSDNEGKTRYSVSNIRVNQNSFSLGQTRFSTRNPNVFTAAVSGARISISADYSASTKIAFFRLRSRGGITVSATGVSFSQSVALCNNEQGKPTFTPVSCSATIGDLDIRITRSRIRSLLNFLLKSFRSPIRRFVESEICKLTNKLIRDEGRKLTQSYPATTSSIGETSLDLSLAGCPVATSNSFAVYISGQSYCPSQNPSKTFPFSFPPLPSFSASRRMVQGILSEYALNTLVYSLWQKGLLSITISQNQLLSFIGLDESAIEVLAAGMEGSPGSDMLDNMRRNETNGEIEITINAPESPRIIIASSGISLKGAFKFSVRSAESNESEISLTFDISVVGGVRVNGTRLQGSVSDIVARASSATGLDDELIDAINEVLGTYLPVLFTPLVEDFISEGVKIPNFAGYTVTRPSITLKQNAIEVAADITASNRATVIQGSGRFWTQGSILHTILSIGRGVST